MKQPRILVVCDGNTCRSPTLMLLLRHWARQIGLANQVYVDSAGVGEGASKGRRMAKPARTVLREVVSSLSTKSFIPQGTAQDLDLLAAEAEDYSTKHYMDTKLATGALFHNVVMMLTDE